MRVYVRFLTMKDLKFYIEMFTVFVIISTVLIDQFRLEGWLWLLASFVFVVFCSADRVHGFCSLCCFIFNKFSTNDSVRPRLDEHITYSCIRSWFESRWSCEST